MRWQNATVRSTWETEPSGDAATPGRTRRTYTGGAGGVFAQMRMLDRLGAYRQLEGNGSTRSLTVLERTRYASYHPLSRACTCWIAMAARGVGFRARLSSG